jgi:hypothetical protein
MGDIGRESDGRTEKVDSVIRDVILGARPREAEEMRHRIRLHWTVRCTEPRVLGIDRSPISPLHRFAFILAHEPAPSRKASRGRDGHFA